MVELQDGGVVVALHDLGQNSLEAIRPLSKGTPLPDFSNEIHLGEFVKISHAQGKCQKASEVVENLRI